MTAPDDDPGREESGPPPLARTDRRRWPVFTLLAVGTVAIAAIGLSRLPSVGSPPTPVPAATTTGQQSLTPGLLTGALGRQARALSARDRRAYLASWDPRPAAQRLAALTYTNLLKLGVASIAPKLAESTLSGGAGRWTAEVDVTWRLTGMDATSADSALLYRFAERDDRALVVGITPLDVREPIWLLPSLEVRRGPATLVAASDPATAARVARLLSAASVAVAKVLPHWHGDLVAYAPGTVDQFDALIGESPGPYERVAAVTTTVDGSRDAAAPSAIVLNPKVFGTLGPIGAHVVVTHEATHAATHAAAADMPPWVAEGFADYVGIGSVDVPTAVAARAALGVVRRDGPPASLPADAAFKVGTNRLEATYEEAWLATSLIAQTYGQAKLVTFYRAVEANPDALAQAFTSVLHTTEAAFTQKWRGHLEDLAHAG